MKDLGRFTHPFDAFFKRDNGVHNSPLSNNGTDTHQDIVFPERKELTPVDYFIVIADDRPMQAKQTEVNAVEMFPDGNSVERIRKAADARDLFLLATQGNAGRPADVVLLDDDYSYQQQEWVISNDGYFEQIPPFLYGPADSISFALALRAVGYSGKIVVVSNSPPDAEIIESRTQKYNRRSPDKPLEFPIDGCVLKNQKIFAKSRTDTGGWSIQRAQSPTHALAQALSLTPVT